MTDAHATSILLLGDIVRALKVSLISRENDVCSFHPDTIKDFRKLSLRLAKFIEREGRENIHPTLLKVAEEIEKIGDDGYNDVNALGSAFYRGRGLDIDPESPIRPPNPFTQKTKNPFGPKP